MRGTHEGSCGARLPIPRLSREPSSPGEGLPCQLVPLAESWATPGPDKWAEARSGQNLANPACLCLRAPGPPVPSLDWVLGARRGSEGLLFPGLCCPLRKSGCGHQHVGAGSPGHGARCVFRAVPSARPSVLPCAPAAPRPGASSPPHCAPRAPAWTSVPWAASRLLSRAGSRGSGPRPTGGRFPCTREREVVLGGCDRPLVCRRKPFCRTLLTVSLALV